MKTRAGLMLLLLTGCAAQPLPTYPLGSSSDAIETIAANGRAVRTVQSTASIRLTSDGKTIVLDGALCFDDQGHLRVRAWKLGQAVFDVTVNDDGFWQFIPRAEAKPAVPLTASVVTRFVRALRGQDLPVRVNGQGLTNVSTRSIAFVSTDGKGNRTTRTYDRQTLTLRSFTVADVAEREQFRLDFATYKLVNDIAWPTNLTAVSVNGRIEVKLSDVEINQPLPPTVFQPPARAERVQ